jgi:hypothetical protein
LATRQAKKSATVNQAAAHDEEDRVERRVAGLEGHDVAVLERVPGLRREEHAHDDRRDREQQHGPERRLGLLLPARALLVRGLVPSASASSIRSLTAL